MTILDALRERFTHLSTALIITAAFITGFAMGNQHAIGAAQGSITPPPDAARAFEPFWQVYNLIQSDYLDEVDAQKLVDGAIDGMTRALDDPYSGYITPELYPIVSEDLAGEIEGIGVVIETVADTGAIQIVNVLKGSPAERAGLRPGDIFAGVNGEDATKWTQTELALKVRGRAGTPVKLTMRRGDELIDFTITRGRITVPNIESRLLDEHIGYIKLNQFTGEARTEIDTALRDLKSDGELDGIILDLRGNPGGLLTSVIDVTSAFKNDGAVLIEQFSGGREERLNVTGNFTDVTTPMVVLVDEFSASASEVFAGALQDDHRATIIGETTFGKGTVQTLRELVNGGGLRLTVARWLTPDGNWIHEQGITPDILVEWTPNPEIDLEDQDDPQLNAALDHLESMISVQG